MSKKFRFQTCVHIAGFLILLIIFLAFTINVFSKIKSKEVESVLKQYKEQLYYISDFNNYDPDNKASLQELIKSFEKYFTKEGYSLFNVIRTPLTYRINALNGKYNMKLKDLKILKDYENKKDSMIGFTYIAEILIIDQNNTEEVVKEEGYLNLVKTSDGWKLFVDKVEKTFRKP